MKLLNLILILSLLASFYSCSKTSDENERVLNLLVSSKVKGMDPAFASDKYSSNEISRVYEGLLEYHYLWRPYKLVPNLAEALPVVSKDGLTYTFKIKQGVLFQDNKAFSGGKGRELVAQDFVYTIKRLADPKLQSDGWWLLDGKIKGLNEWRDLNAKAAKVDYDQEVAGVKALDKYTLEFVLAKPFPQFLYSLAMSFTFATAREVVEFYGKDFLNHPVGTGAFMLDVFDQSNKITYKKNPTFRKKLYPVDASSEFNTPEFLADAGKPLPLVDKIIVNIIIEDQPGWLNFQKGKIDIKGIPKDNFASAIQGGKTLAPDLAAKGIMLDISPSLDVTFTAFNHTLKIFQNANLRRAMSLVFDEQKNNELFYNGTALPAQSIIPPGIAGYLKGYQNLYRGPDLAAAKVLLVKAGFPDGKGLPEITYDITSSSSARQQGEFFVSQMALLGIKVKLIQNPWPELQNKVNTKAFMLYGMAWGADYPDAENFLQLLYGPNKAPGANGSNYNNPVFDEKFRKASQMQDTPERTKLYEELCKIVAEEMPLIFGVHRQGYTLTHGWLKNYISTDFEAHQEIYLNVDIEKKKELIKKL
jgi:ABC-type transport system substrate-binding protein